MRSNTTVKLKFKIQAFADQRHQGWEKYSLRAIYKCKVYRPMWNIFLITDDAVDWRKLGFLSFNFYSSVRPHLNLYIFISNQNATEGRYSLNVFFYSWLQIKSKLNWCVKGYSQMIKKQANRWAGVKLAHLMRTWCMCHVSTWQASCSPTCSWSLSLSKKSNCLKWL